MKTSNSKQMLFRLALWLCLIYSYVIALELATDDELIIISQFDALNAKQVEHILRWTRSLAIQYRNRDQVLRFNIQMCVWNAPAMSESVNDTFSAVGATAVPMSDNICFFNNAANCNVSEQTLDEYRSSLCIARLGARRYRENPHQRSLVLFLGRQYFVAGDVMTSTAIREASWSRPAISHCDSGKHILRIGSVLIIIRTIIDANQTIFFATLT